MNRMFSAFTLLLVNFSAWAQDAPIVMVPRVEADPTGMIVFAVVLVALIGGYVAYIWVKERDRKKGDK